MKYEFAEFRDALKALGMTQAKFAALTGGTPHRITAWRHAKRGVPGWARSWLLMWKCCDKGVRDYVSRVSTG